MGDSLIWVLFISTLTLSMPLVLAAMGGLTSERSGIINIGLEGKMLGGAVVFAVVATHTGSALLGLAAGIGGAILLSLVHWLMTQVYEVDHIISGMAINAIAFGAANYIDRTFMDPDNIQPVPTLTPTLYYAIAFATPIGLGLYLARARGGLRLLAVGEDPDKARQMGLIPQRVRFLALVATGVFCGLAGALVVAQATHFTDTITAGRGFIALAALILGGWRPVPAAVACIGFGLFQALQLQLQGTEIAGASIPTEVWQSVPYLITVIALAGFMGSRTKSPSGLGKS